MGRRVLRLLLLFLFFCSLDRKAKCEKATDPYKVLGVDRSASRRDIQKAFHKLSLKFHPDKNKNKGAQENFTQINNAYEILSDEEKKNKYDLYGNENADPKFSNGNFGRGDFGGHGVERDFRQGGWPSNGQQGKSFSFSFSFSFDGDFPFGKDIFSILFGGKERGGPKFKSASHTKLQTLTSQTYEKEIVDQGLTWILLFYTPSSRGYHQWETVITEVGNSLQGVIKTGGINCQSEQAFCKKLGMKPSKSSKISIYSYGMSTTGSLVEYTSSLDSTNLKSFCKNQLPKFSQRTNTSSFDSSFLNIGEMPQVLLLSTKKTTPVIWRALSGLYRKRFVFLDAEAHDVTDKTLKHLGVRSLPALVGRLANGEVHVLKEGITVKDLKSGMSEIKSFFDSLEKKNNKVSNTQNNGILSVCGDKIALCITGIFRWYTKFVALLFHHN